MITEDNKKAAPQGNGAASNSNAPAEQKQENKQETKTLEALHIDVDNALVAKNKAAQDYANLKDGTDEDIEKFSKAVSDTSKAYDDAVKARDTRAKASKSGKGTKKVRILLPPAGVYKLPYDVGQVVAISAELAAEMVETKYAEYA